MRFAGKILALVCFAMSLSCLGLVLFVHNMRLDFAEKNRQLSKEKTDLNGDIAKMETKLRAPDGMAGMWDKARLENLEVKRLTEDRVKFVENETTNLNGRRKETDAARKEAELKLKEYAELNTRQTETLDKVRKTEASVDGAKKKKNELTQDKLVTENALSQAAVKLDLVTSRNDGVVDRQKELNKSEEK